MTCFGMLIWPFVYYDWDDQTVWSFIRQCFAIGFFAYAIIQVEVILKFRKCTIPDVMFKIGLIGVFLTSVESLIYVIVLGYLGKTPPMGIAYLVAVFGSKADGFLTFARILGAGLTINLCFILTKYSSSLKMWAICGLYFTISKIVIFRINNDDDDDDFYSFTGFAVWFTVAYFLCILNSKCGQK